ncbi:DUF397 domain-containing protein [Streptomyces sp. NPDC001339]|uniref:DUF397 domain-containing protein n=1 Tax=Streptomyces sp. NPDC001339 TaxID=3364563 RepID=UPI0036955F7C
MSRLTWQKSSFSEAGSDHCVEVAVDVTGVPYLRDSKRPDIVITTSRPAFCSLIRAVRAGELGHLVRD